MIMWPGNYKFKSGLTMCAGFKTLEAENAYTITEPSHWQQRQRGRDATKVHTRQLRLVTTRRARLVWVFLSFTEAKTFAELVFWEVLGLLMHGIHGKSCLMLNHKRRVSGLRWSFTIIKGQHYIGMAWQGSWQLSLSRGALACWGIGERRPGLSDGLGTCVEGAYDIS